MIRRSPRARWTDTLVPYTPPFRSVGDAWGEIERAQAAYRGVFYSYQYLEQRAGERSLLFGWARDIVRAADERAKPDAARLPRYTESTLPSVEQRVRHRKSVVLGKSVAAVVDLGGRRNLKQKT